MIYYTEKDGCIILKQFLLRHGFVLNDERGTLKKLMQVCLNRFDDRSIEYKEEWTHETINRNSLLQCVDDNKETVLVDVLTALLGRRILRPTTSTFIEVDLDSPAQMQTYLMEHANTEFGDLFYFDKENLDLELKRSEPQTVENERPDQDSVVIMANVDYCSSINIETESPAPAGAYLKLIIPGETVLVPKDIVRLFKEVGEVTDKYGIPIVIDDHTNKEDTKMDKYTFDDAAKIAILSNFYRLSNYEMSEALDYKVKFEEFKTCHRGTLTTLNYLINILSRKYYSWMLGKFDKNDRYDGTIVGVQSMMGGPSITRMEDSIEILHRAKVIHYNPLVLGDDDTIQDHTQDLLHKKITTYILFCEEVLEKCLK